MRSVLKRLSCPAIFLLLLLAVSCTNDVSTTEELIAGGPPEVAQNLRWYIEASENGDQGIQVVEFGPDYYLVELEASEEPIRYIWVDKKGTQARYAVDADLNPKRTKTQDGRVWFLCSPTEPWPAFPYYIVANPSDPMTESEPWYKTPADDQYSVGKPGTKYQMGGWGGREEGGLEIHLALPDELQQGETLQRVYVPKTTITEKGNAVTIRLEGVSWAITGEDIAQKAPIIGMRYGGGLLTDFVKTSEYVEFCFEVDGEYSYFDGTPIMFGDSPPSGRIVLFFLFT